MRHHVEPLRKVIESHERSHEIVKVAFEVYQFILNSPDTLLENPQQTGELPRILNLYLQR